MNIAACRGSISKSKLDQYHDYWERTRLAKMEIENKKRNHAMSIHDDQAEVVSKITGNPPRYADPETIVMPARRNSTGSARSAASAASAARSSGSTTECISLLGADRPAPKKPKNMIQTKIHGDAPDPEATAAMDVALADYILSKGLSFNGPRCPKLQRVITCAKQAPLSYKPPGPEEVGGHLLDKIYEMNWGKNMTKLRTECLVYGVTVFGDGATIMNVPKVNVMGAGVHCASVCLDIVDASGHCAKAGTKNAKYLASLFIPIIRRIEEEGNKGAVDLLFFDGASNVQLAGKIIEKRFPRITCEHGAEHVVSLFFSDCYTKVQEFQDIKHFTRLVRNVFGSTRHCSTAMFNKHCKIHNNGIKIGLIKPSDCRMGGKHQLSIIFF